MAKTRRAPRSADPQPHRYTIDASVFVNAFNPHESGHDDSYALLASIAVDGDPILIPTLVLVETASAVARATGDGAGALEYALAIAELPHVTLVTLTTTLARQAAELAAAHRLRGADAVYVVVARRYATTLVSLDREQRLRGGAVVPCQTPDQTLAAREP